jgi:hypothetical protein
MFSSGWRNPGVSFSDSRRKRLLDCCCAPDHLVLGYIQRTKSESCLAIECALERLRDVVSPEVL